MAYVFSRGIGYFVTSMLVRRFKNILYWTEPETKQKNKHFKELLKPPLVLNPFMFELF